MAYIFNMFWNYFFGTGSWYAARDLVKLDLNTFSITNITRKKGENVNSRKTMSKIILLLGFFYYFKIHLQKL